MLRLQWIDFLARYEEGLIAPESCCVDLETGALAEVPAAGCGPRQLRLLAAPRGERADGDARVAWPALSDRDHLVVFSRYEEDVRRALEESHFARIEPFVFDPTASLTLGTSGDARTERRALRSAVHAAFARAPGARETLHVWQELIWKLALTEWCARCGFEPPPFADAARLWSAQRSAEHERYEDLLLARLETWLTAHAPEVAAGLGRSASPETLAWADAALSRPLPRIARKLFAWHDGSHDDSDFGLFLGSRLLPLSECVHEWKSFAEIAHRERWPRARWRDDWIPLFARPNGDRPLVLELSSGHLFTYDNQHDRLPEPAYWDLTSWLESYVSALSRGLFDGPVLTYESWQRWKHHDLVRACVERTMIARE